MKKRDLSKDEELLLTKETHRIMRWCEYNFEGRKTKQEQMDFINGFSDKQL